MDADKVSDNINVRLANQAREIKEQRERLQVDKAERARLKAIVDKQNKDEQDFVRISDSGNAQLEAARKNYTDRIANLAEYNEKNYQLTAKKAADDIKQVENMWAKEVHNLKASKMEHILMATDQSQDPFYHMKSLNPQMTETEKEYTVKMALPEHEAKNLIAGAEGSYLNLSLYRRYQESFKDTENNRMTKTNSYQTVVDQVPIPGPMAAEKMVREYSDGILTIRVPKQTFVEKV